MDKLNNLNIPDDVLKRIETQSATINDFVSYQLFDKVSSDCLEPNIRGIVNETLKVIGFEHALFLDWKWYLTLDRQAVFNLLKTNFLSKLHNFNDFMYETTLEELALMMENFNSWYSKENKMLKYQNDSWPFFYDYRNIFSRTDYSLTRLETINDTLLKLAAGKANIYEIINDLDAYLDSQVTLDFISNSLSKPSDRKVFDFIKPYIEKYLEAEAHRENNHDEYIDYSDITDQIEDPLLFFVLDKEQNFDTVPLAQLIDENPNMTLTDFVEKASLIIAKSLPPEELTIREIVYFNKDRTNKFTFGQEINVDILQLIDQHKEYESILKTAVKDATVRVTDYNNIEDLIAYLINKHNLYYYSLQLPSKFQQAYPEFFLTDYDNEYYMQNIRSNYYNKEFDSNLNRLYYDLNQHPKLKDYLCKKNISLGFKNENMRDFIIAVGNEQFLNFLEKYGVFLVPVKLENENQTYEDLIEAAIIESIKNNSRNDSEFLEDISTITEKIPEYFLDKNAPDVLRTAYYHKRLLPLTLQENSDLLFWFDNKDIFSALSPVYQPIYNILGREDFISLSLNYGKYLYEIDRKDSLKGITDECETKEMLVSRIDALIFLKILKSKTEYDDKMPSRFQEKYPHLFLPKDTPIEIQEKFYTRSFNVQDFINNPDLLKLFKRLNIACYLEDSFSWLISIFNDYNISAENQWKIVFAYAKINDNNLQRVFERYLQKNIKITDLNKIESLSDLLFRLSYSNSSEMLTFRSEIAEQLLTVDDPFERLDAIEDIFLKNNLPVVGKVFSTFRVLHPDFKKFSFSESSKISPILKSKSTKSREVLIFADLLKAAMGSNNRSIQKYLENIEQGNKIFLEINAGKLTYDQLDGNNQEIFKTFVAHLNTLYNNTVVGKKNINILTGNISQDINQLIKLFSENNTLQYDLPDRIIRMFGYFAGFENYTQAKEYFIQKPKLADLKHRQESQKPLTLEVGDFIKGINRIDYLKDILQNGSVAKEFLGDSANSDYTPLDTDLSRILTLGNNLQETINQTAAKNYGTTWLVLKNDDRIITTRKSSEEKDQSISEKPDLNKLEAFYTGVWGSGHYGIRTGFASSEIDYIITQGNDPRIGLEIAMNGFYIPVIDTTGKLIFSAEDYDNIRAKMAGLTYYNAEEYKFSDTLMTPEVIELAKGLETNEKEVAQKRNTINHVIKQSLAKLGLVLKNNIDGDLSEGSVELLDTGSTGRGTNMLGDGDFDFIMRVDKKFIIDSEKMQFLKNELLKAFNKDDTQEQTKNGDFRLKGVNLSGIDTPIDIDITFVEKTDKLRYSTESCLKDRLDAIKKQSPTEYKAVVANILLAKEVLKKAEVYKPNRGEVPQGGLGGVGIENWILQNNGSFIEAANSFVKAAEGKNFYEFISDYTVWDFGENHFASKNGNYPHDNFVKGNMNSEGYKKMQEVLKNYLNNHNYLQDSLLHK